MGMELRNTYYTIDNTNLNECCVARSQVNCELQHFNEWLTYINN